MNKLDLFWSGFNADCEEMGIEYTQTERQINDNKSLIEIVTTSVRLYRLTLLLSSDRVPLAVKCYGSHGYIQSLLNTISTFRRYYGIPILSLTVDEEEYPRELTITFWTWKL